MSAFFVLRPIIQAIRSVKSQYGKKARYEPGFIHVEITALFFISSGSKSIWIGKNCLFARVATWIISFTFLFMTDYQSEIWKQLSYMKEVKIWNRLKYKIMVIVGKRSTVTLEAARNEIPAYYHWDFNSDYFCILVPPSFEITQKSFWDTDEVV